MRYLPQPARPDDHYELAAQSPFATKPSHLATLLALVPNSPAHVSHFRQSIRSQRPIQVGPMSASQTQDMADIYKRMRSDETPEGIGPTILQNPANIGFRCAYCEIEIAKHVDHFTPKTIHPELALSTANLVPSCSTCNGHKQQLDVAPSGMRLPHPYLDRPVAALPQFLFAEVTKTPNSFRAEYSLRLPADFSSFSRESMTLLFSRLHLLERYGVEGTILLSEERETIEVQYNQGRLTTWARGRARELDSQYGANHFKTALFSGLANLVY